MGETADKQSGNERPAIDWASVNLLAATAAAAMEFAGRKDVDVTLGKGLVWEADSTPADPANPEQINQDPAA